MAESNSATVRAVAWSELFPWLSIVRAFRLAIAVRALILGAVGILLTVTVWGIIGTTFGIDAEATAWLQPFVDCPWLAVTHNIVPDQPSLPGTVGGEGVTASGWNPVEPISGSWTLLSAPATEGLSRTGFSLSAAVCLLLCGLTAAAIWAFFGAAICRTAAVRLAADEQVGVAAALRFACRKWISYFFAPLVPIGIALVAACVVLALGWLMQTNPGLLLAGFLWPLVLVAGFLMALLLLLALCGWPLMWPAISAEGTDTFDALSRSFGYVLQRPLRYLFYIVVAAVVGWLGWILVRNFAAGMIWMGYWAAGWGCGNDQINAIRFGSDELSGVGQFGAGMIRFFAGCVKLLAVGYLFSYFWTASTAIYFLLRRDVDATELDEVFLDADASEQESSLPPVAGNGPIADNGGA